PSAYVLALPDALPISTERAVTPSGIDRTRHRASASAQFGNKKIVDILLFQTRSQGSFAKLRQASGTGKTPHVRYGLYSIMLEQRSEEHTSELQSREKL